MAAVPPTWNWPDTPVRYHAETQIIHPYGQDYRAVNNLDVMAGAVVLKADIECTSKVDGEVRDLDCHFAWFDIDALPMRPEDQTKLNSIMDEWRTQIKDYHVEMVFGLDGKMRLFDLEGTNRVNERSGVIIEQQRLLLLRMFCLLNSPLPKTEKEWTKGWKDKGWHPEFMLLSVSGTSGAMGVSYAVKEPRNGYLFIETEGHGAVNSNSSVDANSAALIDCNMGGATLLDEQSGMIYFRNLVVDGVLTASAGLNSNRPFYQQNSAIQRVETFNGDGSAPPVLGSKTPETPVTPTPPAPPEAPVAPTPPAAPVAPTPPAPPPAPK